MAENGALTTRKFARTHQDLVVYQASRNAAMRVFESSKKFPREEVYSLTSQIRRSSRSVAANVTEAWRKRRYEAAFISKLSDAECEAAETQVHLEFAVLCGYLTPSEARPLYAEYNRLLKTLVGMIHHSSEWTLKRKH